MGAAHNARQGSNPLLNLALPSRGAAGKVCEPEEGMRVAALNPSQSIPPRDKLVLVIDDDEIMRLSCAQILKKAGYRVETFGNGHDGVRRMREVVPPLLVVDIKMPELDGFEVISIARKLDPNLVIVVITGYATIETAVDAMKAGAYDFCPSLSPPTSCG